MDRILATFAVFLAVLAITAPLVAGPAFAADTGEDSVTLPKDIAINSDASVQEYEQNGSVTGDVTAPQMSVTIGDEREDVGLGFTLDPLDGSTRNDFVRVEHKEEMTRTVRIPIHGDYWKPFPRESLSSMDENHTARMEKVQYDGETHTLLTVTFEGKDSAVFPIPEDAIAVYSASERTEKNVNSTFGIDLGVTPSPWSEIEPSVFENETAVRIEGEPEKMMIQYNDGTAQNPEWLHVPEGQKSGVPVYQMQKDGVDGAVYVVSTSSDAPTIRYKTQATWGDKISVWTREAESLPERVSEGLGFEPPDFPFAVVPSTGVSA